MKHLANVEIEGGRSFRARAGQTLLDAALLAGVDMPHDCRSGHCGTCRCTVVSGSVLGGETDSADAVLACQSRVIGDVSIAIDETPPVETRIGRVRSLEQISADVMEAVIDMQRPLPFLPGQYCQFRFAGFPGRCYSPTAPLEGPIDRNLVRLHIRQIPNGRLSSALGGAILPGHKVKVDGPYGSAFLRPGKSQRLVLAASGTGFAPIWSIALAALAEMPDREIVAVVGARTRESFYMVPALKRLAAFPKVQIVPVLQYGVARESVIQRGSPADCLPRLNADDIVYACGGPGMTQAIAQIARTAGATCFVDPFVPAEPTQDHVFGARSMARAAARAFNRLFAPSADQTA